MCRSFQIDLGNRPLAFHCRTHVKIPKQNLEVWLRRQERHHMEKLERQRRADWSCLKRSGRRAFAIDDLPVEMKQPAVNGWFAVIDDRDSDCSIESDIESISAHGITGHRHSTDNAISVTLAPPRTVDVGVQCCPNEMLEPIALSNFFQQQSMVKISNAARLWQSPQNSYCVALHFSLFEDPDIVCAWSQQLSTADLEALADRFLGSEVVGVALQRRKLDRWRQVSERYVKEAAILAQAKPVFREALFRSAWRLLLGGQGNLPRGSSLLDLALEDPQDWSAPATTALDFTSRLVQVGVLPQALMPELFRHHGTFFIHSNVFANILLCCKSRGLGQRNTSGIGHRTMSSPATLYQCKTESIAPAGLRINALRRTTSFDTHTRNIGTTLRPQDDLAHSRISFAAGGMSLGKKRFRLAEHEIIPIEIGVADVPDYWRHVAGGEHLAETLERFARKTELSAASVS